jgi:two-component sensor histidine kinase/putative methionine-R-sulfoxide reductase with GAF domain
MNTRTRIRPAWPDWLVWALPAGIGLIVAGYQVIYQVTINPTRSASIFWGEVLVFGIVGPLVAWLLLRQLAWDAKESRAAAVRIESLAAEERHRAHEMTALYVVSAAINQALSEEGALTDALARVLDVLDLTSGRIYLLNPNSGPLTLAAAQGEPALLNPGETTVKLGECLCGLAAQTGEAQHATGAISDPLLTGPCRTHTGYACVAVPLLAKERPLGVLQVTGHWHEEFAESEMALLRSIGAQIGVAVENMRLREEARRAEALSTLIQEMHHRIKNNLQTVADLLSLEMSASPSPAARKSLRDSVSRIKSIAAVHELLSLEQLRLTDITELARQVCDISLHHMLRPDQRVTAEINGPAIYLPSKQATALALVMNELIANALEHAFRLSRRDGLLRLTLTQEGAEVTVTIADNGIGLPQGFDLANRRGLGLQIVQTLVEKDLAGSLRLENRPEGGSLATLTFYK